MQLYVDAHSPIPIRRQLAEQLKHFIESGGFPRKQALPSIREMAGFLGINPNTVARARCFHDDGPLPLAPRAGHEAGPGSYLGLTRSYWCTIS